MRKSLRSIFTAAITLLMLTMLVIPVFAATTAKITRQPSSVTVAEGSTARVTLAATGDGRTYKWYYKNRGEAKFTLTTSFKGASYSVPMTVARAGRQVYCVVTDKYGNSIKSKTATLSMKGTAKITTQPKSVTVSKGAVAKVTVKATGSGLKYQWYYKDALSSSFTLTNTFKSASYSVKMTAARAGRQIYCVITDKYGISVKTNTITLSMRGAVKITTQPKSTAALEGTSAKVVVKASGSGLKYQWYFKDTDSAKFSLTTSYTGTTYKVPMTEDRAGRKVYCVITDKYGASVKTKTVTLSMDVAAKFTKLPPATVVVEEGAKTNIKMETAGKGITYQWYIKNKGSSKFSKSSVTTATYNPTMSQYVDGRQVYCVIKDSKGRTATSNTVTIQMKYNRFLIVDKGVGAVERIGVPVSGKYTLKKPVIDGYTFKGWVDRNGKTFASNGTIKEDTEVFAVWKIDGTNTREELLARTNAGVRDICITADIAINQPIFISYDTTIYADTDCSLIRAPKYSGDMFVVGQDKKGNPAVLNHREATLTLGGGKGLLTVSGNRKNVTAKVVGSALYVCESATVNILDNVLITNNIKQGNKRIYECTAYATEDSLMRAGGAAILNINGTVNMFGGELRNNLVATTHTVVKDETGAEVKKEYFGCGGAVYNRGNFNMYGGTITTSEALRGGGVYNDRVAYLEAGTISNNESHTYGGGISSSSSSNADIFIGNEEGFGTMAIVGNHSNNAGGGIYSNTWSPIIIYGNTLFKDNVTETSGGAIYSAGSITARGATFEGNSCTYSGGAIYHHYANVQLDRRIMTLEGCTFDGNSAGLGGAVILSAVAEAEEMGAFATITNCTFQNNQAKAQGGNPGNGAALYITRKADATITGCSFVKNVAANNAGAIAIHSGSQVKLSDSTFQGNMGAFGGAIYTSSQSEVDMKNLTFTGNAAVKNSSGNGGNAGAIYTASIPLTFDNLDFYDNHADGNGGAVYLQACQITVDESCQFSGNTAGGHGGVFYLTYTTNSDGTRNGAKVVATNTAFESNTAMAGGVFSIRSSCEAVLKNVALTGNTATGEEVNASGGGAIYVGYGALQLDNVTATGNQSAGHGGAVNAAGSTVTVTGGSFTQNTASSGGAINGSENSAITLSGTTFTGNGASDSTATSKLGGGAVNIAGGSLTVTDVTMENNTSGYYGGAILARKAEVSVENSAITGNTGVTGGALYFRESTTAILNKLSVNNNTGSSNGVIYQNAGSLTMTEVNASGNRANNGGVLYTSGNTPVSLKDSAWNENTAGSGGAAYVADATFTVEDCQMQNNTAVLGGVIYNKNGTVILTGNTFAENAANKNSSGGGGNGGVISMAGGLVTSENNTYTDNTAENHAGGIYVSYMKQEQTNEAGEPITVNYPGVLTAKNDSFTGNSAMGGGAISIRTSCEATVEDTTFEENSVSGYDGTAEEPEYNDGDGEGGGAIYVGFGKLTLNNVTAKNNTAQWFGGVVDAYYGDVTVNGGSFTGNSAVNGGVIFGDKSEAVLTGVELKNNASDYENKEVDNTKGGGVVHMKSGKLTVSGCTLDGNSTGYYGGAIFLDSVEALIHKNTVISHSTGTTGAALYVKGSSVATVTDVQITDNVASSNGVVYVNYGSMTLTNVTATRNTAARGGVFYTSNARASITAENCSFTENTATGTGGVAYADSATVSFVNCTLTGNQAKSAGVAYTLNGTLNFTDCEVASNTATSNGGAIYTDGGNLNISGTTFQENQANGNGGAVYTTLTAFTLEKGTFNRNSAGGHGGAIDLVGVELTLSGDNHFTENAAGKHGGAIYVVYHTAEDEKQTRTVSVLDMTGGSFTGNTAMGGGAVSARTGCTASFDGTIFTNNAVTGFADTDDGDGEGGGAIYVGFGTVELNDVTAAGNTASGFGGVVDSMKSTVTVNGGNFIGNSAGSGGAFYALSTSTLTITDANLQENTSTYENVDYNSSKGGGAVNISGGGLNLIGVTVKDNTTDYYGGAILTAGTTVRINGNSVFTGNTGGTGGALYFKNSSAVTIEDTSILNNTATNNGVLYCNGGALVMNNVTATGNQASNGGLIYNTNTTVTIQGGTFSNNTAKSNGGVIDHRSGGKVTISGATFSGNTAKNGGAIYLAGKAALSVDSTTFSGNSATVTGGAIYNASTGIVEISKDTEFVENTAPVAGAIHLELGANTTVSGATFTGNTATGGNGGAIRAEKTIEEEAAAEAELETNPVILTMENVVMQNNTATENGGAVALHNTAAVLEGCQLKNNSATLGGAIYCGRGELTIADTAFQENTAVNNGGAVSVSGTEITATGSNLFEGNKAGNHAGAIYVAYANNDDNTKTPGVLNMTGGILAENEAKAGGAISSRTSCQVTLNGTTLSNNTATSDASGEGGGAIYSNTNTLTLTDVTMEGNTSAYYGGAVFTSNVVVTMNTTTVSGNHGVTGAGLYFRDGGEVTLNDVEVTDHKATDGSGVIYVTSGGPLTATNLTASGNSNYTGAVFYVSGSANITLINPNITGNTTPNNGGAVDFRSSGKLTITGGTISGNTAKNGGAVYTAKGTTEITNCLISENTATAYGGGIYGISSANVTLNGTTVLSKNTALAGGGIYLTQGATGTANGITLTGNAATTGDGGGILVAESSEKGDLTTTLTLTNVTFKKNTAASKGGGLSTDYGSPNLVIRANGCVFEENKATGAGGGAVEIQNVNCSSATDPAEIKIVFANTTFTGNTAKTTGGAVEIRSSSCAKFDGIIATGNKAGGNGGVFYATSVHSRLYLTGTVTQSNNTASKGVFAALYNSNYTNPPKIYTTHSNTADWVSAVFLPTGNTIVFDLKTMP